MPYILFTHKQLIFQQMWKILEQYLFNFDFQLIFWFSYAFLGLLVINFLLMLSKTPNLNNFYSKLKVGTVKSFVFTIFAVSGYVYDNICIEIIDKTWIIPYYILILTSCTIILYQIVVNQNNYNYPKISIVQKIKLLFKYKHLFIFVMIISIIIRGNIYMLIDLSLYKIFYLPCVIFIITATSPLIGFFMILLLNLYKGDSIKNSVKKGYKATKDMDYKFFLYLIIMLSFFYFVKLIFFTEFISTLGGYNNSIKSSWTNYSPLENNELPVWSRIPRTSWTSINPVLLSNDPLAIPTEPNSSSLTVPIESSSGHDNNGHFGRSITESIDIHGHEGTIPARPFDRNSFNNRLPIDQNRLFINSNNNTLYVNTISNVVTNTISSAITDTVPDIITNATNSNPVRLNPTSINLQTPTINFVHRVEEKCAELINTLNNPDIISKPINERYYDKVDLSILTSSLKIYQEIQGKLATVDRFLLNTNLNYRWDRPLSNILVNKIKFAKARIGRLVKVCDTMHNLFVRNEISLITGKPSHNLVPTPVRAPSRRGLPPMINYEIKKN